MADGETLYPLEIFIERVPVSLQASGKSQRRWMGEIAQAARQRQRETYELGFLDNRPLAATIYYFASAPMEGDIDNIVKPIMDGLTGVAYLDDKVVERVIVQKFEPEGGWEFSAPSDKLAAALDKSPPVQRLRPPSCAEPRSIRRVCADCRFVTTSSRCAVIALDRLRRMIERMLEIWVVFLVSALTVIVVLAVIWRKAGASFVWYDEVGSIMLAWITYYGAALAALKRAHIGFDGILLAMPYRWRIAVAMLGEIVVFAFFIMLAWPGMMVLEVLQGMRLISLPGVPVRFTQSVIPIGATLFIICEALSLPEYWHRLREGISADVAEVMEQMHAQEGGRT
jgi:TRAP-type C4-dicarboxylate transport system permease small subunit